MIIEPGCKWTTTLSVPFFNTLVLKSRSKKGINGKVLVVSSSPAEWQQELYVTPSGIKLQLDDNVIVFNRGTTTIEAVIKKEEPSCVTKLKIQNPLQNVDTFNF